MTITKIERQKKNTQRVNIFLDGEFAFGIHRAVLLRWGIRSGDTLTDNQKFRLMSEEEGHRARLDALRLLRSRLRTEHEIREKLREREYGTPVIDTVITSLQESGMLNDTRFAEAFVHDMQLRNNAGPRLLRQKLNQRGVPPPVIEQFLGRISGEEQLACALHTARRYLRKTPRIRSGDIPIKQQQAVSRHLFRRGFDWTTIGLVLKKLFGNRFPHPEVE
jgi:regulatory protein